MGAPERKNSEAFARPKMKSVLARCWVVLVAAMFLANGAAAAARACTLNLAGQEHAPLQARDAGGDELLCPEADTATRCLEHCTQGYKSTEQKLAADIPAPVLFAPPFTVIHAAFRPAQVPLVVATAPPIVGPPLTILFRNLRN